MSFRAIIIFAIERRGKIRVFFIFIWFSADENKPPEQMSDSGGYYVFENGLIMQWGITPIYQSTNATIIRAQDPIRTNFAIPFPNKCLSVQVNIKPVGYTLADLYQYDFNGLLLDMDKSGFSWSMQYYATKTDFYFRSTYFAIGY